MSVLRTTILLGFSVAIPAGGCGGGSPGDQQPTPAPTVDPLQTQSTSAAYGGKYIAQYDFSDTGPSLVFGTPEIVVMGVHPAGVHTPLPVYMDPQTDAWVSALSTGDSTVYDYQVTVRQTHGDPDIGHDVHLALIAGTLNTEADYHALRLAWHADRIAALAPDISAAQNAIVVAGGTVLDQGTLVPKVAFSADEPALTAILSSANIKTLAHLPPPTYELAPATGADLRASSGTGSFVDVGSDIDGDGTTDYFDGLGERVAIIEPWALENEDHPGFFDNMAPWGSSPPFFPQGPRLAEVVACSVSRTSTNCGTTITQPGMNTNANGRGNHGLLVSSVGVGDLSQYQDFYVTAADRDGGTFQAPEAEFGYFSYKQARGGSEHTGESYRALGRIYELISSKPEYQIASLSFGGWSNCKGQSELSEDLHVLFDSGVLPVVAAGNDGNGFGGGTSCTINAPADSFAALTVGASIDGLRWQNPTDPSVGSSVGHLSTDGRTLVDVLAPGRYDYLYYWDPASTPLESGYLERGITTVEEIDSQPPIAGEYCNGRDDDGDGTIDEGFPDADSNGIPDCAEDTYDATGTSLAAPAVAGALLDYRQFYTEKYSRLIDDPGIAMVQALLWGDAMGATTKLGFETQVGAGRFNMQMTNSPNLNPSWGWGTGRVCVPNDLAINLPIRNALPADVKTIRAVAWWRDDAESRNDIDLAILENGAVLEEDVGRADTKKRVSVKSAGGLTAGAQYELQLRGVHSWGEDDACGFNQQLVHWAFIYADDLGL